MVKMWSFWNDHEWENACVSLPTSTIVYIPIIGCSFSFSRSTDLRVLQLMSRSIYRSSLVCLMMHSDCSTSGTNCHLFASFNSKEFLLWTLGCRPVFRIWRYDVSCRQTLAQYLCMMQRGLGSHAKTVGLHSRVFYPCRSALVGPDHHSSSVLPLPVGTGRPRPPLGLKKYWIWPWNNAKWHYLLEFRRNKCESKCRRAEPCILCHVFKEITFGLTLLQYYTIGKECSTYTYIPWVLIVAIPTHTFLGYW
jgi:hypothetical protein